MAPVLVLFGPFQFEQAAAGLLYNRQMVRRNNRARADLLRGSLAAVTVDTAAPGYDRRHLKLLR